MIHAVSNIALSAYSHEAELDGLKAMDLDGLEVAPSRVWRDTWQGLKAAAVTAYRERVEAADLRIVGLHSLFFDHPELGLFRGSDTRARTMDFMVHLSAVCRDLGGRTLIFGGGRRRGSLAIEDARDETVAFCAELCARIEGHGTCYCFEPLGPADSDFINTAGESLDIVDAVDHPALKVQLDAKALVANDEVDAATFRAVAGHLVHVHANEPDLGVLGTSGTVDHAAIGRLLGEVGYDGTVSIEQRMLDETDPLADVNRSAAVLKECYP